MNIEDRDRSYRGIGVLSIVGRLMMVLGAIVVLIGWGMGDVMGAAGGVAIAWLGLITWALSGVWATLERMARDVEPRG